MNALKRIAKDWATAIALIALLVIFSLLRPNFFTLNNLFNILDLISILSVSSVAMCFVLLMGSIDLSVEGVIGLTSIVASTLVKNLVNANNLGFLALPVSVAAGAACGLLSGLLVTRLRIPSFMATLGIGYISSGIGTLITRGTPIVISDWAYRSIAISRAGPLPTIFLISAAVILLAWVINQKTILGRHIVAMGGDESIVKDIGVHTEKVKILVFVIAGALYRVCRRAAHGEAGLG